MISGFPIKLIIPIKNFIKAIVTFTDFQFKLSFLKKIINLFYFYFYYIVFFFFFFSSLDNSVFDIDNKLIKNKLDWTKNCNDFNKIQ